MESPFSRDYAEARSRFRRAAEPLARLRSYVNPQRSPSGEELATDAAWFGSPDADSVLVLVSGTHGVEGFCGSAAQLDWIQGGAPNSLGGIGALLIHAINPFGFAWLRRVTEEGVDLNRNFVDFAKPLPENPGYDELADAFLPAELDGAIFAAAEAKIRDYRSRHGERGLQDARTAGQYKHPSGFFHGGMGPTWSRRTLETIIREYELAERRLVAVVDFHTGLGPYGYGELISAHRPDSLGARRTRNWYGESVTEMLSGTASASLLNGIAHTGWEQRIGERLAYITLEFGTYSREIGRAVMRDEHWLHNRGAFDWTAPETQRIKQALRHHFFPDTEDWNEAILFRSRQVLRQAVRGVAREHADANRR